MAGKIKVAASAMGRAVLDLLKLLVLSFWVGGGLVVGGLASHFLERLFTERQLGDKAGEVASAILSSFSTMEVIAGGVLCVLIFLFERKCRRGVIALIGFGVLVVLTAINQFIISGLQGYGIHSTVYQAIFYCDIAIALIFLAVLALSGKTPAAPAREEALSYVEPEAGPPRPPAAPVAPVREAPPERVEPRGTAGREPPPPPPPAVAERSVPMTPASPPEETPVEANAPDERRPKDGGGGEERR